MTDPLSGESLHENPREVLPQSANYLDSREVTRSSGTFEPNHHISSCLQSAGLPLEESPVPSQGLVKAVVAARCMIVLRFS